jgi:hypothetical protein
MKFQFSFHLLKFLFVFCILMALHAKIYQKELFLTIFYVRSQLIQIRYEPKPDFNPKSRLNPDKKPEICIKTRSEYEIRISNHTATSPYISFF